MKSPFSDLSQNSARAVFGFLLLGYLLVVASASSLCDRLLSSEELFIWAIGYSGPHFYVFANDYTGYELSRQDVLINSKHCIIDLSKAKPKTIVHLRRKYPKFPQVDAQGIIGEVNGKHFVFIKVDVDSEWSYLNLDEAEPKEAHCPDPREGHGWPAQLFLYNSDQDGKFVLQIGDNLYDGQFTSSQHVMMSYLTSESLGTIKYPVSAKRQNSRTGFIHMGILYTVNNRQKKVHKHQLGADAPESGEAKDFSEVFDCDGTLRAKAEATTTGMMRQSENGSDFDKEPNSEKSASNKTAYVIISAGALLFVGVLVLGLVVLTKKKGKKRTNSSVFKNMHLSSMFSSKVASKKVASKQLESSGTFRSQSGPSAGCDSKITQKAGSGSSARRHNRGSKKTQQKGPNAKAAVKSKQTSSRKLSHGSMSSIDNIAPKRSQDSKSSKFSKTQYSDGAKSLDSNTS